MRKSVFTPLYDAFRKELVAMRKAAGLTQRGLASRVRREHSFVARIEQGERRLDVVEFYWVCRACNAGPARKAAMVMAAIARADRKGRTAKKEYVIPDWSVPARAADS